MGTGKTGKRKIRKSFDQSNFKMNFKRQIINSENTKKVTINGINSSNLSNFNKISLTFQKICFSEQDVNKQTPS